MVLTVPSAPSVKLDDKYYKLVDKMEALCEAPPSLKDAKSLTVKGPVLFRKGCVFKGDTLVVNGEQILCCSLRSAPLKVQCLLQTRAASARVTRCLCMVQPASCSCTSLLGQLPAVAWARQDHLTPQALLVLLACY